MTAVHSNAHHGHSHTSNQPGFTRSGLGTPDMFHYGPTTTDKNSVSAKPSTPSWYRPRPAEPEPEPEPEPSAVAAAGKPDEQPQKLHRTTTSSTSSTNAGDDGNNAGRVRASSDPPTRSTPTWIVSHNQHAEEPNPFERSFSGKQAYENVAVAERRARSQSPKPSSIAVPADSSRLPPSFGSFNTPSTDLGGFQWGHTLSNDLASHAMFDPSSIRTGLTPGAGYPPHSPATQALFAMMTNTSSGLVDSHHTQHQNVPSASRNDSGSSLSSSSRSPQPRLHQTNPIPPHVQHGGFGSIYSQSVPRPIGAPFSRPPQPQPQPNYLPQGPAPVPPPPAQRMSTTQQQTYDDAVLAAAAGLSGLSTPRGTFVGGPAPAPAHVGTIAPTNLNVSTSANLALPAQPPHRNSSNSGPPPSVGKPEAPGNKRKGTSTTSSAQNAKKPKRTRTSSRRAAANAAPIVDPATDDEEDENANAPDDDSRSIAGSSRSGRSAGRRASNAGTSGAGQNQGAAGSLLGGDSDDEEKPKVPKGGKPAKAQFETEEDKRKNFLERNRQAALKCRQRKKAWLQQLQQKVEYLTQDNETLQGTVSHLREEITSLRGILLAHKDCPAALAHGHSHHPHGAQGQGTIGALLAAQSQNMQQYQAAQPPLHNAHLSPVQTNRYL